MNTYGYDASRQLLKELGDLLKTHLRTVDSGGRYGYDEFILLMANTGLEDAVARAKRMRLAIEGMTFTPQAIRSSVSIGVAAYPDNGRSIEQVLLTAKKAVFEAQREGRNNVFAFREDWYTRNGSPVGA